MMRPAPRRGVPRKSGYPDDMNNMRAIITRTIIVASVALYAIVAVPDLTFAAPNCNLQRDLENADLSQCNLHGANLRGDDPWGANLTKADFTNADLTDAFRRPGINRADLAGVKGLDSIVGLAD